MFLLAQDAVRGKMGMATAIIKGDVRELFELRSITASINKRKEPFESIGAPMTQHKTVGAEGTGTMTFYNVSSDWAQLMVDFIKTGIDVYFDVTVINDDPSSLVGRQVVTLQRCNLNSADIARIDVNASFLDATAGFTFEDCDIPQKFREYSEARGA